MDRLESMSVLLVAVEAGSLSGAARRLGTPLATVSRKVSELETHLKTRLLTRSSRRLTLTDAGRAYVAACKRILEDITEAERAASGEYRAPKGELVITAPIVFGRLHVLPVAVDFLRAYPEVDVRLFLADHVVNLLEGRIDLAVRIGDLPDSSLVASRVGLIRRVVCGSPAYFAERGMPETPDDLQTHECITFQGQSSPETWTFGSGRTEISVPIHSRLVVNTAEAAIDAAIADAGIARAHTRGFRARTSPGEPGPYRSRSLAGEAARVSRFRAAAPESADSEIGFIDRLRQTLPNQRHRHHP